MTAKSFYVKIEIKKPERMPMKKLFWLVAIALVMIFTTACSGGGDGPPPIFVAEIISDQSTDGDIAYDGVLYTITPGPDTVFFGIDDLDPNLPEYRAFLDFPLDGSTGQDVIPANAVIVSATLEVYINEVSFTNVVPTDLDLVLYPVAGLEALDFVSTPLASQSLNFFNTDVGHFVSINVTPLMREAQRLGLDDFQVRFVLDLAADFGFVGIEDGPDIAFAPILTVEYQ
jgi:hypothetical protein